MTAADRPSDDARAEVDAEAIRLAPVDDVFPSKDAQAHYRCGFRDGAEWAAGRAETTTATADEDVVESLAVELFERSHEPSFSDDRRGMDEAREWAQRIAADLLARPTPSREQIATALSVPDVHHPDHCDCGGCVCDVYDDCHCDGGRCDGLQDQVAAVLALLEGGTDE